jgi:hypothetical protein
MSHIKKHTTWLSSLKPEAPRYPQPVSNDRGAKFSTAWAAYKKRLQDQIGREPDMHEVVEVMKRGGWEFEDSSGPL